MKRFALGVFVGLLIASLFSAPWMYQAWAVGNCSVFRTWNTGDTATAGDLNSSFTTAAVTNSTLQCLDDFSATVGQMQSTTDPYASSTESLATSAAGEIERLRFMFKQIFGPATERARISCTSTMPVTAPASWPSLAGLDPLSHVSGASPSPRAAACSPRPS